MNLFFSDPFLEFETKCCPHNNLADSVLFFSQYISHTLGHVSQILRF